MSSEDVSKPVKAHKLASLGLSDAEITQALQGDFKKATQRLDVLEVHRTIKTAIYAESTAAFLSVFKRTSF